MKKSTLVAVVVFLGLLALVLYSRQEVPERGITELDLSALDTATIDRVEIAGKNPVVLEKEGETWHLDNGKVANQAFVTQLLEALPKIASRHLVTEDPARHAELEVDDTAGTAVTAQAGGTTVAQVVVGKSAGSGTHVRRGDEVYLVSEVRPYVFSRARDQWHRLELFQDVGPEKVDRVEIALLGAAPYALVKKDDVWQLEDPSVVSDPTFRFDREAASTLVSTLVRLRARSVLETDPGAEVTGLGDDATRIAFSGPEGLAGAVRLGKEDEGGNVHAQLVDGSDVYLVPKHATTRLAVTATDLRDLGFVDLDPATVVKLEIEGGETSLTLSKQDGRWAVTAGAAPDFQLDEARVSQRVAALARAKATQLAADSAVRATGLARPQATVTATTEDGSRVTVRFGSTVEADGKKLVHVQGNADDLVYLATEWVMTSLVGGPETLRKVEAPPTPQFDPAALANLPPEVRQQLMQQMRQQQMQEQLRRQLEAQGSN